MKTRGEVNPDTNIIIIHFSEDDIARIGPWPIKRNYYALLINQLIKSWSKKNWFRNLFKFKICNSIRI